MSLTNLLQQLVQVTRRRTICDVRRHHVHNLWPDSKTWSRIWMTDLLHEKSLCIVLHKNVRSNCNSSSCLSSDGQSNEQKHWDTPDDDSALQKQSYLEARRKGVLGGRRKLSPLQRVGGMISTSSGTDATPDHDNYHKADKKEEMPEVVSNNAYIDISCDKSSSAADRLPHLSQTLQDGEFVIITRENLKRQEKLVRLIKLDANLEFKCKFGNLLHTDIIGRPSGSVLLTGMDIELLVRRPSLEEFVIYMKRTPVIAYPKDCCTMMMMIDASPGDVVLEAGSGSGAMTLFLSRAVGHSGQVFSFEKMETHQKRARKNFESWARSWNQSHRVEWPQNVSFYSTRLQDCGKVMGDVQVDGAVIDMEEPWTVMKTMSDRLKAGRAMAVYVANLTQVIDIAEVIRKEKLALALETTLEVAHKVWVVNPARRHGGNVLGNQMVADKDGCSDDEEMVHGVKYIKDEAPKYLARPHHLQPSHSAFLVRIRKIRATASTTTFKV